MAFAIDLSSCLKELTRCRRRQSFRSSTSPRPRTSTWSELTARSWNAKYRASCPSLSTWISGWPTTGRFTRPDRSTVWGRSMCRAASMCSLLSFPHSHFPISPQTSSRTFFLFASWLQSAAARDFYFRIHLCDTLRVRESCLRMRVPHVQ